jgi:hypothetical protein
VKRFALLAVVMVAALGCQGCPWTDPPVVHPSGAAGAPAPDWNGGPATCLDFCRRGSVLNCAWAQPTAAGATCVEVCANNQKVAIAPWDLDCRTAATNCNPPKCQ